MKFRLALVSTVVACAAAAALPGGAAAATYHVYKQGSSASKFGAGAYFNKTHRKLVTLSMGGSCDDGSVVSISTQNLKVSSSGRFSGEIQFSLYHRGTQTSYPSTAQFSGKVTKRKRVRLTNSVTTTAPGCEALTRTYTLKYKGTQSGG